MVVVGQSGQTGCMWWNKNCHLDFGNSLIKRNIPTNIEQTMSSSANMMKLVLL